MAIVTYVQYDDTGERTGGYPETTSKKRKFSDTQTDRTELFVDSLQPRRCGTNCDLFAQLDKCW